MAEIILSQAGAALGAKLLPSGLGVLGKTLSGAALGGALGQIAGRAIDVSLADPIEGPRLKSLHIMESREGAGLPRVYGRMRVGGQVIWASRFKEHQNTQSSGKGGPSYTEYTYSVSFAVAIAQGPITRVDRVWANGEILPLNDVNYRLFTGTEAQLPDPLIEAIEGAGEAPAYRGTAYMVFEDLPLDAFGHRLPQLSFEVVRAGQSHEDNLSRSVTGVNIIPASGEFVYATTVVRERQYPGIETPINMNNTNGAADFSVSLSQLQSDLPLVSHAALTVAWFGDDLRAGACRIRPGVEVEERMTVPFSWSVGGVERHSAHLISRTEGAPNYGGTPADHAVREGLIALKAAGLGVTLSPFLMMDVPPENGLPDPYGGAEQAAFPWRGRIRVSQDGTEAARQEIEAFVGEDGAFGFRHFILHHARLAVEAGGVDAFLIGSEMVQLTRVRDADGRFPFVEALVQLAEEVKEVLGDGTAVSYAADWTEYGAYVPQDSSGDVLFPLDPLWASPSVDFVGVDWYPPLSDWRSGDVHLDYETAQGSIENRDYLSANLASGEAYDWYYASEADRLAQIRTPILDTAHGEHWVFRQKDLTGWWTNSHFERQAGTRIQTPTAWTAQSKPIRLIEIGYPAIDMGTNAPNLFFDPKSSESAMPPFSNGLRDDLLQRRALSVACPYWLDQPMVDQVLVWAWDARPWPDFPARSDVWSDGDNWQYGHWLNGRTGLIDVAELVEDLAASAGVYIDVRAVSGAVEGISLEGVTSLASALSPIVSAFELILIETSEGPLARSESVVVLVEIEPEDLVEDSFRQTQVLLDKKPSAVRLNYVSGDADYQQAVIEVRDPAAETYYPLSLSLPMVLGETKARSLAQRRLNALSTADTCSVSLPPNQAPNLAVADRIALDGEPWIVQGLDEHGLERHVRLNRPRLDFDRHQYIESPKSTERVHIPATPFSVFIDGPNLDHLGISAPFIAASADPWLGLYRAMIGPSAEALSERATVLSAAGIGRAEQDIAAGPLGRWDKANALIVYMPGETLASASETAVRTGQNYLLAGHEEGWELLAWTKAELISEHTWRLSGLLRGLAGSPIADIHTGACLVLADTRLVTARFSAEEVGVDQVWQFGAGDLNALSYLDRAGLPCRVGHLRAEAGSSDYHVSWTVRDRSIPDNWDLNDDPPALKFQIEAFVDDELVLQTVQTERNLIISSNLADTIRVSVLSNDGRVGEWGSIPLSRA